MAKLDVRINKAYWGELLTSPEVDSMLMDAASKAASKANSKVGQSTRNTYKNENFIPKIVQRHGDTSAYHAAIVAAGNPRSNWYAFNRGAFNS